MGFYQSATPADTGAMAEWIMQQNILRFERLLRGTTDAALRNTLSAELAEEKEKLRLLREQGEAGLHL